MKMIKRTCALSLAFLLCLSGLALAGDHGKGKPGDDFRKAGAEYTKLAEKAMAGGNAVHAKIYKRLAEIKAHAAKLADAGKWKEIDWTEYKKLQESLGGKSKGGHDKGSHKK